MKNISIPIRIEENPSTQSTGNVVPLLHEIKHALKLLIDQGKQDIIDLSSIPMTPGDEKALDTFLGRGEVKASLDALGKSKIFETCYTGVWLIIHYNEHGERIGRFIEITTMPEILKSQRQDMDAALTELNTKLNRFTSVQD